MSHEKYISVMLLLAPLALGACQNNAAPLDPQTQQRMWQNEQENEARY